MESLIAQGIDVNAQDPVSGETSLALACRHGHDACVRQLLANKADVYLYDNDNVSPLMRAAQAGHAACVQVTGIRYSKQRAYKM